jgi:hypothetical protein
MKILCHSILIILSALLPAATRACDHCGCDQSASEAGAGPLLTPTAATLGAGKFALSLNTESVYYEEINPQAANALINAGADLHDRIRDREVNLSFTAGLTENLALTATLPFIHKRAYEIEDQARVGERQSSDGPGDAALALKWRFYRGRNWQFAALGKVKFATGKTDRTTPAGDLYEPELQPGSGATDFSADLIATRHFSMRTVWSAAFEYVSHGMGTQDYRFGDLTRLSTGLTHTFNDPASSHAVAGVLDLVALHAARDSRSGIIDAETGNRLALFIAPGLTARLAGPLSAFLSVPIAVHDAPNGRHQKTRHEITGGIAVKF